MFQQSLIPSTLHVPGIDSNIDLLNYIRNSGILFHPNLTIDNSLLGGIGLFFNPGGGNGGTSIPQGTIVTSNTGYDHSGQRFQSVVDIELLRIPRGSAYTIITLIRLLEELKLRDQLITNAITGLPPIKESELIINFLNCMEPTTETHILITYFLAFKTIQNLRKRLLHKLPYYQESPVVKLDTYLNILSETSTIQYPGPHFHNKYNNNHKDIDDEFINTYCEMSEKIKLEYESLIEQLKILYRDELAFDIEELLSFESYFQIFQAIRSRILEIPRAVHNKTNEINGPLIKKLEVNETGGESLENIVTGGLQELSIHSKEKKHARLEPNENDHIDNTDDYVIDISLVPILDFVNHNHNNNSYFDIDRRTNDIVLKLKSNVQMNMNDKFEVTISYDPEDNIKEFLYTYGFVPQILNNSIGSNANFNENDNIQLFEMKLNNLNRYIPNSELMCKWLRILPQIQFVIKYNNNENVNNNNDESKMRVYINFFSNNLPLLFIPEISYNQNWLDVLLPHFIKYNNIPEEYDTNINGEELVNMFLYQEEHYDYINGIDPIGIKLTQKVGDVSINQEPPVLLPDLSSILEVTNSDFEDLIKRTLEFIVTVYLKQQLKHFEQQDAIRRMVVINDPVNNFDELVDNYQNFKIRVFNQIIKQYKLDPLSLILPESIAKVAWETEYRTLPRELTLEGT